MACTVFSLPFTFAAISLVFSGICLPVESDSLPRGVSRAKGSFYKPGSPFTCLDGSDTIPFDQINDDYCDCKDGSDEPGTSACHNGRFYCVNKGYKPESIPSSRVSDGVCDCCDGSDEYEGKTDCPNNCMELGKAMREEMDAMRKLIEEGYRIRADYIKQGQQVKIEKQGELVKLGPQRDQLQAQKDELMLKKNEAEAPEKEAKDKHEAWWKEQKELREAQRERQRALDAFQQLDLDKDDNLNSEELLQRTELNADGTLTPELARDSLMSGHESVDAETFVSSVWPNIKDKYTPPPSAKEAEPMEAPPTKEQTGEEQVADSKDDEDDDSDFEEDDFEDDDDNDDDSRRNDVISRQSDDDDAMPPYPDDAKLLIAAADAARQAYEAAEKSFGEVDKQIQEIEKFLGMDLGSEDEFYPIRGECFEFTDREYTYKVCPFDKASQRPKGGGSETNLGTFTQWEVVGDEKYGAMKFEKGLHCWNGPDRSATVIFHCGKENQLTSASEPNRCEYAFDFTTPAACHTLMDPNDGMHHVRHTEL